MAQHNLSAAESERGLTVAAGSDDGVRRRRPDLGMRADQRHSRGVFPAVNAFVARHHRHHKPARGHKFSIGAALDGKLIGVVIVGRPVARMRDDGRTAEVARLCTDGTRNACSFLYGAAARAALAMGYLRIGTYTLASEPGTSLRAAGWRLIAEVKGRSWDCASRPRIDSHPLGDKLLWELTA